MIRSKTKKNTGVSGVADVRVLAKSLRIHFKEDDDQYDVSLEGWERESGLYNIVLEKTNDKVKYISPPGRAEPYLVRFKEFGNRQNEVPEPKKKDGGPRQSQRGGTYWQPDTWVGVAKLEVVEKGIYNGLVIPYNMPYVFISDPGTTNAMLEGTRGENKRVEEFLRLTGIDFANEDIPFQGNILPWLEIRLQSAGKYFTVTLNEKGFVDVLAPLPAFMDVSSILGSNGKKAKSNGKAKAASKSKAKK